MDLVVDPAPDGVKLPGTGYTSGSLQDNVTISNDRGLIGGHLKYTTGMVTMYPDDRLKQEGNYIALWLHEIGDPYVNYDKIEAKVVDGEEEKELEVSDEGYICFRVDDRATTKLVVTVTIGEQTYEKEFKFTALNVDAYGWNILKGTNQTADEMYQWIDYFGLSAGGRSDTYSDDETKKYFFNMNSSYSSDLAEQDGLSFLNENVSNYSGLGNEWIKSQFTIRHTKTSVSNAYAINTQWLPLKAGTKYTLSYYEKGTYRFPVAILARNRDDYVWKKGYVFKEDNPHEVLEDSFSRYTATFTTDDDLTDQLIYLTMVIENNQEFYAKNEYTTTIAGLKLEEGDHATGWDDYWSGDNLLLDTDQPDFENHNENIGDSGYREIAPSSVSKSVSFLPDGELPYPSALINNKYTITTTNESYAAFRFYGSKLTEGLDLKDGDLLTASFYIKASRPCRVIINDATSSLNDEIAINDTSVNRIVRTYIQKESGPNFNDQFVITMGYFGSTATTFEFYGIKLEKGCHVTDYRPAPSDFNINYALDSGSEKNFDPESHYLSTGWTGIKAIQDLSYGTPIMISLDSSDLNEEDAKKVSFFEMTTNPGSTNTVPILWYEKIQSISKDLKTKYYIFKGAAIRNPYEYQPQTFNEETKITGFNLGGWTPDGGISNSFTISHVKFEVGRYPTKWVDGSGEPAPSSEEDDSDLEVT